MPHAMHVPSRSVVLRSDDVMAYHRLAPLFESLGIHLHGVPAAGPVPADARVVLATQPTVEELPVHPDDESTLLGVLVRLDDRPVVAGGIRHVVVGLDPGLTIGMALLVEGRVLWTREVRSPAEAAARIAAWQQAVPATVWSIHIGDGSPTEGAALFDLVKGLGHAHVVPERASSRTSLTRSRHTDAAIRIALRRPMDG